VVEKKAFSPPRPALLKLKAELAKHRISKHAAAIIDGLFEQWDADPRIVVDRRTSQELGDHRQSYQILLENRGELDAIEVDGRIRITVDSIYRRLILKTLETHPADGVKKIKSAPAELLKARDERAKASKKHVRERELVAAPSTRRRARAKKPSELSVSAE
jgi:hypothetical protein